MKKLNLLNIALLSIIFSANAKDEEVPKSIKKEEKSQSKKVSSEKNFFRRMHEMHKEFEREMDEMFEMHEKMYDDFFAEDAKFKSKDIQDVRKIEISKEKDKEGDDWIVLTVHLPSDKMKYSDINIKAKGNNLEGSVDYNNHKLKFFVARGREFGTTVEYKNESEKGNKEEDKEQKYTMFVQSFSTQINIIPPVANLEKTKANIEDGKLIIRLPSAISKKDWTTINVEKPKQQISVDAENLK